MTTARFRESCGSHLGARLHQEHDEPLCGTCSMGEASRLLYRELIPTRPTAVPVEAMVEVTERQAAAHASELLEAVYGRHRLRVVA